MKMLKEPSKATALPPPFTVIENQHYLFSFLHSLNREIVKVVKHFELRIL